MNKLVSIIIPCRNEEKFISRCLDSILLQDYPKENLEVFVVDGYSSDRTKEIAKEYSQKHPFIRVLDNEKKITSSAMNIGIRESKGDIIMKMDCHSFYSSDYVSKSVACLLKYDADNVGGVLKTLPANDALAAKAIAICLSSFFGAGNSYFRTGTSEPREADTVAFGCYKKEVFSRIGMYNENLERSQDMELNLRLKKSGGKIMLCPQIEAVYYPKDNLADFFLHNFHDGVWAVMPLKFVKMPFSLRHYLPAGFVLSLIVFAFLGLFSGFFEGLFWLVLLSYLFFSFYFSWNISKKEKEQELLFLMPMAFFARHFGYGLGSIWGLIKIWSREK